MQHFYRKRKQIEKHEKHENTKNKSTKKSKQFYNPTIIKKVLMFT